MSADGRKKIITIEPGLSPLLVAEILKEVGESLDDRQKGWHSTPTVRGTGAGQITVYADEGLRS